MILIIWNKRKNIIITVIVLGLLLLLMGVFLAKNSLLAVDNSERLVPIYEVATQENKVAISFDASWGAEYTIQILDTLDEYGVKATFFLVNIWLEDYPDMAKEIVKRGHEIGLHSVTHPHFSQLTVDQMKEELNCNYDLIKSTSGYEAKLFRPPYGDYNDRVVQTSYDCGFTPIQWSVDSLDWQDLSAAEITERVLFRINAGDIVLFHNNGLHTAEALPDILSAFADKGLKATNVSDLLLQGDSYVDVNGIQRQNSGSSEKKQEDKFQENKSQEKS